MTNKELLLQDLSARLPYGVKVLNTAEDLNEICELDSIMTSRKHKDRIFVSLTLPDDEIMTGIEMVKPYLRPMSSMTEEEFKELTLITELQYQLELVDWCNGCKTLEFYLSEVPHYYVIKVFDWLNAHHFDYRSLIPLKLAIEVTEENNPYKD